MTQSSRLAAHRARASAILEADDGSPHDPETMPEEENEEDSTGKRKKETKMTDTTTNEAAIAQARAEATVEANKRFSTVLASEHYAGRETLAQTLLANDKLTAEDITAALAVAPKAEAAKPATAGDADAAARAEMRQAIDETGNSGIDASAPPKKSAGDSQAIWDRAIAANNPSRSTATK